MPLLVPWISNLAQSQSGIEDPSLLNKTSLALPIFVPMLANIVIARLLLGAKARGLAHLAIEQFEGPVDSLDGGRDLAGDALVLAHLTIPLRWLPLMFFGFPV